MDKFRRINRLWILALIIVMVLSTGCLGSKPKATAAPPPPPSATPTASEPTETEAPKQLPPTNTPQVEEAAPPTPEPVEAAGPTDTPAPEEATPEPTSTEEIQIADTPAPAAEGEVYEPIPGCAKSTLHRGDVIRINHVKYVRIRSSPDTHPKDNIVRKWYRTEMAKIQGDPVCNYGWILWPIQTADGTRGWVPESDGTNFWLLKVRNAFPTSTIPSR